MILQGSKSNELAGNSEIPLTMNSKTFPHQRYGSYIVYRYLPFEVPGDNRTLFKQKHGFADTHIAILSFFAQSHLCSVFLVRKATYK